MSRFYESRVTMVVLSRDPIDGMEIGHIMAETDTGDMVMKGTEFEMRELTRAEMDVALIAAGSDPEFFPTDEDDDE